MTSDQHLLILTARWVMGVGYRYDVSFKGEAIVSGPRDPEHDAARALLFRGITGKALTIDAKTGKPRMHIDIAKAAMCCVVEDVRVQKS